MDNSLINIKDLELRDVFLKEFIYMLLQAFEPRSLVPTGLIAAILGSGSDGMA
jgi:hypothetical protein